MRKVVYYVAMSLDGFISAPNDDVSKFIYESNGVQQYLNDLANFDTVIMGKNTYEFGYNHGLKAGQPAYPNMIHYIFSNDLTFENQDSKVHIKKVDIEEVIKIKEQSGSDIYLCGGGQFAGWLLDNHQIDILKLKLNPLILGKGVKLFGDSKNDYKLELIDSESYEKGLQIMTFKINY